jgi:hypothetical protein
MAATTLVTLLGNALDRPLDAKFRRVRENNPILHERLLRHRGGRDALMFVGRVVHRAFSILVLTLGSVARWALRRAWRGPSLFLC